MSEEEYSRGFKHGFKGGCIITVIAMPFVICLIRVLLDWAMKP